MSTLQTWKSKLRHLADSSTTRNLSAKDQLANKTAHYLAHQHLGFLLDLSAARPHTPAHCAERIAFYILRAADTTTPIDHLLEGLYFAIVSAAAELGSDAQISERLADLVVELKNLEPAVAPVGDTAREQKRHHGIKIANAWDERTKSIRERIVLPGQVVKWDGMMLWRDLPGFGPMMRSRKSCPHYGCRSAGAASFDVFPWPDGSRTEHRWLSFNTFLATFVSRHAATSDLAASYRFHGISAISDALEHPAKDGYRGWRSVPAACVWFEIAAQEMAGLIGNDEVCAPGPLWEGNKDGEKVTVGRWRFWGTQLLAYAGDRRLVGEGERIERALRAGEATNVAVS